MLGKWRCEKNMKIVDANIILRYLLNDTEELAQKATDIIENNKVLVPNEIIAEIVYVLEKVYKVNNEELSKTLIELFQYENIKYLGAEFTIYLNLEDK